MALLGQRNDLRAGAANDRSRRVAASQDLQAEQSRDQARRQAEAAGVKLTTGDDLDRYMADQKQQKAAETARWRAAGGTAATANVNRINA